MRNLRSYNLQTSRRTDTQAMANQMVQLALRKAEVKYGCTNTAEQNSFALGYLNSLLATVAASSPAAMKELASALKYAKENQ